MRKSNNLCFLLFFILITFSFNALAQSQFKISGNVIDSLKKPVEGANIRLITDQDTLRSNSDAKGNFVFTKVIRNKFYLSITALGYKPYASFYKIESSKKSSDLDPIMLKTESIRLNDVEVKVKVDPIKIKKDTIEYNAGAYTIRENDKVEDLLKQLQGIEVDDKGAVTAMGKKMTKLRVNGEDFFTSNVEDYIRQLPADIIAKLQVIDDYGDEANFTGIKTGTPQKMLNLVTKPGMDKGVFGGMSVNSATNNAHNLGTNGSIWKKTKQIGFDGRYGITNNEFAQLNNGALKGNIRDKISKEFSVNGSYDFSNGTSKSIQSNYVETFNPQGTINDLRESANNSKSLTNNINLGLNGATKRIILMLLWLALWLIPGTMLFLPLIKQAISSRTLFPIQVPAIAIQILTEASTGRGVWLITSGRFLWVSILAAVPETVTVPLTISSVTTTKPLMYWLKIHY
ncbi:carboxypeptidase-like regulatory domain-containing protein [Pedobacter sp. P26]|uniref:carboxypeptidase-like regulatory domain-containing protein n=1 Tax=Pedobacter sp. P26 TaxID=3423956 RepID=UPI003D67A40F